MQTEMLHGDVIARMLTSDELDQEFGPAGDVVLSGYRTARGRMAERLRNILAGWVPGVFGIMDELACRHRPGADGEAIKEAVAAEVARIAIADVADLAVDTPCSGTVVLSGAVHSRSDLDLAIATAWSVADVEAVDDWIRVES